MYSTPTVSILIPCYNAEQWIAGTIESALKQTYQNKEIIVLDDGSTDNSLSIIKSFSDQITWETGKNQGGNTARNRLLELSSGSWLQYLDADDYLLPDKIEQQIVSLGGSRRPDIIYSPHITEDKDKEGKSVFYEKPKVSSYPEPHDLWMLSIRWHMPQTGGLLVRRQALSDIGGWKKGLKHCQDYDLYIRLLKANKKFFYCDYAGAVYRWWCSGTVTHRKALEVYRDRLNVQNEIESHLLATKQLTALRQDAIYQAKFEYARRVYIYDKRWAVEIDARLKERLPDFEPSSQAAPKLYRQLYKMFGFEKTEQLAYVKRKVLSE